jgi:hypothetical protein
VRDQGRREAEEATDDTVWHDFTCDIRTEYTFLCVMLELWGRHDRPDFSHVRAVPSSESEAAQLSRYGSISGVAFRLFKTKRGYDISGWMRCMLPSSQCRYSWIRCDIVVGMRKLVSLYLRLLGW